MDNTSTTTKMEVISTEDAHKVCVAHMKEARKLLEEVATPIKAIVEQALQAQAKDMAAKFEETLEQALQKQAKEIAEASLREQQLQSELKYFRDLVKILADTNHLALLMTDQFAVEGLQGDARGYSSRGAEQVRDSDNASESSSPGDRIEEGSPSSPSQPVPSDLGETLRLKESLAVVWQTAQISRWLEKVGIRVVDALVRLSLKGIYDRLVNVGTVPTMG
jgi:hypothetical protein